MRNICSGQSPKKCRAPNSESLRLEQQSATCHSEKDVATDIYVYSGCTSAEVSVGKRAQPGDERATFDNIMMFCATNILLQHNVLMEVQTVHIKLKEKRFILLEETIKLQNDGDPAVMRS